MFMAFFSFLFDFLNWFLYQYSLIKIAKRGYTLPAGADMASGPSWLDDVARGTTARMQRGAEATWQGRGWPTRGAQGADTWQEATHVHAGPHGCPCGAPHARGSAGGGPTG